MFVSGQRVKVRPKDYLGLLKKLFTVNNINGGKLIYTLYILVLRNHNIEVSEYFIKVMN